MHEHVAFFLLYRLRQMWFCTGDQKSHIFKSLKFLITAVSLLSKDDSLKDNLHEFTAWRSHLEKQQASKRPPHPFFFPSFGNANEHLCPLKDFLI